MTVGAWAMEDDTILRDLWSQGYSTNEIGRRMSRSKNSIVGRAHRLNLEGRPSPILRGTNTRPVLPAAVQPAGKTTLPPLASTVNNPNGRPVTTCREEESRILRMFASGYGQTTISTAIGVSRDVVRRVVGARNPGSAKEAEKVFIRAVTQIVIPLPAPQTARKCLWPTWPHGERPKFNCDGLPALCGDTRARGSYCLRHAHTAYAPRRDAA